MHLQCLEVLDEWIKASVFGDDVEIGIGLVRGEVTNVLTPA
jgi:hypothetical protein